jgi:hypothetical protein
MKYTGESIIKEMGLVWWDTESMARRVAEFAAKKLNEQENKLKQKSYGKDKQKR